MRVLQINLTYKIGSTGKIMSDLNEVILENGNDSFMMCGYAKERADNLYIVKDIFNPPFNNLKNLLRMRITGRNGYTHKKATKEAIEWIKNIDPDIIHLHNIHGNWIHLKSLFTFLKQFSKPVVWTLHDCWSFTGRCSHFELIGCNKWMTNCYNCKNKNVYPITYFFDFSKPMYMDKKRWYSNLENLIIVTPSYWLANYVRQSFFKKNEILTIHNGINLGVFYPREANSSLVNNLMKSNKKIVLGVASTWTKNKGFDDFLKIDSLLDHDQYQVVMVGLNKKQLRKIPSTIIPICRTNDQNELAELYSNAYVFVNPTYQDNYPTTNMEALACGCPVITYNTGGSPESLPNRQYVVNQGDFLKIVSIIENEVALNVRCENVAFSKKHDKNDCFKKYLEVYFKLLTKK